MNKMQIKLKNSLGFFKKNFLLLSFDKWNN